MMTLEQMARLRMEMKMRFCIRRFAYWAAFGAVVAAGVLGPSNAWAQTESSSSGTESTGEEPDPTEPEKPKDPPPAEKPKLAPTEPVAPPKPLFASDHDMWTGRMGISWFGISDIPLATGSPTGTADDPAVAPGAPTTVSTPAVGVRYWLNPRMGLDMGLGFMVAGGSARTTTQAVDKQRVFAFLLHGGLPLSLATGKHISIQLTPELNFGYAMSQVEPPQQTDPPPNASLSGLRLDVGARFGAEIHFGFIDVPELSLEGSIGAFLTYQSTTASVGEAYATQSNVLFTTASFDNPWEIFTSLVAARYYF